jgi:pyruvate dehydrogenase (quinone)
MKSTAGDVLVDTLLAWGIDTVFGMPGDGINGIIEAMRQKQDQLRFIQVRHEEAAVFVACGYASSPAGSAAASRPPGRAASIC